MRSWTEWKFPDAPTLRLVAGDTGIRAIEFVGLGLPACRRASARRNPANQETLPPPLDCSRDDSHPLLIETASQLAAYFAGTLREFNLPLEMEGTAFQLRVWNLLCQIPYGETRSYADLARTLGTPAALRAVGAANGANPIAIVVPCHRVIGSNGKLTGYGGGLPLKKRLLDLERGHADLLIGARHFHI